MSEGWKPQVIEGRLSEPFATEIVANIRKIKSKLEKRMQAELPGLLEGVMEDESLIQEHTDRPLADIRHDVDTLDFTVQRAMYVLAMYHGLLRKLAHQTESGC